MQLDPSLTKEEWLRLLQQARERVWGDEHSPALNDLLDRLAIALQTTANYDIASEEEPYLLDAQPFPPEPSA
jgi:hypothetical protein